MQFAKKIEQHDRSKCKWTKTIPTKVTKAIEMIKVIVMSSIS